MDATPLPRTQDEQKMYNKLDNMIKEIAIDGYYWKLVFLYFAQLSMEDIDTTDDILTVDGMCQLAHAATNIHNYYTVITYLFTLKHQKNPFFPDITFVKLPYPHYYDMNGDVLRRFIPKPNHIYDWLIHEDNFVLFEYSTDGTRTASYTYQPANHKCKMIKEQIFGKNKLEFYAKPEPLCKWPDNMRYEIIQKSDDDEIYFHHRYNNEDTLFAVQVVRNNRNLLATAYMTDGITCLDLTDNKCNVAYLSYARKAVEINKHHFDGFYLAESPVTGESFSKYSV